MDRIGYMREVEECERIGRLYPVGEVGPRGGEGEAESEERGGEGGLRGSARE